MDRSVELYLRQLWDQNICPNCGKTIPDGTRVGSGKKSQGGFCALDCYAEFYKLDLERRAFHIATVAKRHQES